LLSDGDRAIQGDNGRRACGQQFIVKGHDPGPICVLGVSSSCLSQKLESLARRRRRTLPLADSPPSRTYRRLSREMPDIYFLGSLLLLSTPACALDRPCNARFVVVAAGLAVSASQRRSPGPLRLPSTPLTTAARFLRAHDLAPHGFPTLSAQRRL
jgi:hypothetical protein